MYRIDINVTQFIKKNQQSLIKFCIINFTLLFLILLLSAWYIQGVQGQSCQKDLESPDEHFGYLSLSITEQALVAPYFEGDLFLLSTSPEDAKYRTVTINRSAEGIYGQLRLYIPLVYDSKFNGLRSKADETIGFFNSSGSHRYFPFDSAKFNFSLTIVPPLHIQFITLRNQLPGFLLYCHEVYATTLASGSFRLEFTLHRNPIIQLYIVVLVFISIIFGCLLLNLKNVESLSVAIASYFFSLWSLRGIIAGEIKVFPTLFDCLLLTIAMLLLVGLLWKVLIKQVHKNTIDRT